MTSGVAPTAERAHTSSVGDRKWLRWGALAAAVLVAAFASVQLLHAAQRVRLVDQYKATLFWVDYGAGFVRRALPGQLVRWLGGPSVTATTVAACLLLLAAAMGYVLLARWMVSAMPEGDRLIEWVLVCASPLAIPLLMRDAGRLDTVGVIAAAVIAGAGRLGRAGRSPWIVVAVVTMSLAVAAASEEFLTVFLGPVAVVAVASLGVTPGRRVAWSAIAVTPAFAITTASFLAPAPLAYLAGRATQAQAAGVPAPDRPGHTGALVLAWTREMQLADVHRHSVLLLVVLGVVLAAVFAMCCYLLWTMSGRPSPRAVAAAVTVGTVAAVGLSFVGVDYVRWWGLAFVGVVAVLAVLGADTRDRQERLRARTVPPVVIAGALLVIVVTQRVPVGAFDY